MEQNALFFDFFLKKPKILNQINFIPTCPPNTHDILDHHPLCITMSSSFENPPAYAPAVSAATSAPVCSTFAVRVGYTGCAPRNAMVSMPPPQWPASSSSVEPGSCLEARIDEDNRVVTLLVSARDAEIANYCKHIADELRGTIRSCKRITTNKQRRAAFRSHDSESESECDSDSEVDRLTRSIAGTSSGGNWLIDVTKLIVIALIAYVFGSR